MPLTLHHLGLSQSERIIWLAEELGLDYNFVFHKRDPIFAPKSLKDIHPAGTAPVIEDDPSPVTNSKVVLTESGAIIDYIIAVHGNGRLALTPKDADYPHYIEWFHFGNGTFQPLWISIMMTRAANCDPESPIAAHLMSRVHSTWAMIDARLAETGAYIAGKELTAADIMIFFTLTTLRGFIVTPDYDTEKHKHILAYLQRVGERPAYRKAIKICEGDDFVPVLEPKAELFDIVKAMY